MASDEVATLIAAVAARLRLEPATAEPLVAAVALELLAAGDAGVAAGFGRGSVVLALANRIAHDLAGYTPPDPPRPHRAADGPRQQQQRQQQQIQEQVHNPFDRSYGAPREGSAGGAPDRYLGVTHGSGGGKDD